MGGFSFLEVLIALLLMVVILAIVFSFYVNASKTFRAQTSGLSMQQAARVAVDELSRSLMQAAYGTERADPYNAASWQEGVIYAGPHAVAFNADLDPARGPIDSTQTLTFPTGETYTGEGASATTDGAETYVYTLDADGNNTLTLADRSAAATGSYNPAASTENPLDFALFRRIAGYDGSAYTTDVAAIIPYLFTNAVASVKYADNATPEPLFSYLMTEDLNGDNLLDDAECVNDDVDTCPPGTARAPLLYVWGDSDFDGVLSDSERDALRTLPVGDPGWSKNPFASAGAYVSTTLSSAVNPSGTDPFVLQVADAAGFAPGVWVEVGSGSSKEMFVVESVSTTSTPDTIVLSSDPANAHAAGAPVAIVPETLRAAIKAVQINFTAIAPRKDLDNGGAPAGQTGHATDHGMDYRTLILQKTVELINLGTAAWIGLPSGSFGLLEPQGTDHD